MDEKFYARRGNQDDPQSAWQPLLSHLSGVAASAAEFASTFSSTEWGRFIGSLHDVGKYQLEFQRRLKGERIAVEHSGVGAVLAAHKNRNAGTAAAFAIAGHHTGLPNKILSGHDTPSPLMERLSENEATLRSILPTLMAEGIDPEAPALPPFLTRMISARRDQDSITRSFEFWVRLLFSCLVDADRLDSEAFCEREKASISGVYPPISELRERLDVFISDKVAAWGPENQKSGVNTARAEVFAACRDVSNSAQGFFSLTVPTGGGKTLSSMSFALRHAEQHNLHRVIVVIPYTSIIEQNAAQYREALGSENVVEHQSNFDAAQALGKLEKTTAEKHELAAENWDAPVIVTTTVQFFESLFSNHPSRCRKLHNIARSVIVLDEVQTLPPGFLLPILDGLNELVTNYGCSVVLSTATPPALVKRERFPHGLTGVRPIIADPQSLFQRLERVRFKWDGVDSPPREWPDLAAEIASHKSVLAIVHRRNDARTLANLVRDNVEKPDSVRHLSALMCPAHRSAVLAEAKEALRRGEPCRLISTQLVEAGVDIDFPVVYRALGGLDSVVQAAGRCNREGRLDGMGTVVVFKAPTDPPPGTPKTALGIAMGLLRQHGGEIDTTNPAVFDEFFQQLYFLKDLDVRQIQRERAQLNFATVGRDFRMIEDGFTRTVVVPYGDADAKLDEIGHEGPNRRNLRALQPYTVSIYEKAFQTLLQAGALEEIAEGVFALTKPFHKSYDTDFGLVVGDEIRPDPGALVS